MTEDRENKRRDEVPDRAELARGDAPTSDQRRAEIERGTAQESVARRDAGVPLDAGDEAGTKPTVQDVRTARSPDPGRTVVDPDPAHQQKRPGRIRSPMLAFLALVAVIVLVVLLF